jgi:hypothetical protein
VLRFVQSSELQVVSTYHKSHVANRRDISTLDRIREELCIPWRELNKLAAEQVGREIRDCRFLTTSENRRMVAWMKENRSKLYERYRKEIWK